MEYVPYIVGLLGLLGIGKLLSMAYAARLERQKVQKALDQTNSGKEIDADVNAFEAINTRLSLVETRLDTVNEHLTKQLVENAKLEAENVRLSKDNERQEKEIERQRLRLHGLANDLQERDKLIYELKITVERLAAEVRALGGHTTGHSINVDEVVKVELVDHETKSA